MSWINDIFSTHADASFHYEVQARLRDEMGRPLKNDETGREMQPDVILHYPQGQDAIVDSKVSLVAYEKYVNAETPEEKERYLQEHIKSGYGLQSQRCSWLLLLAKSVVGLALKFLGMSKCLPLYFPVMILMYPFPPFIFL